MVYTTRFTIIPSRNSTKLSHQLNRSPSPPFASAYANALADKKATDGHVGAHVGK